jgi:hypothetical protein
VKVRGAARMVGRSSRARVPLLSGPFRTTQRRVAVIEAAWAPERNERVAVRLAISFLESRNASER